MRGTESSKMQNTVQNFKRQIIQIYSCYINNQELDDKEPAAKVIRVLL